MALNYNITSLLSITDAHANVNALTEEAVNNDAYDLAFVGVANFLSGNYIQNSANVASIKSNVGVDAGALNNAHFFLVSDGSYPAGGESNYGINIEKTGMIFGSAAVTNMQQSNTELAAIATSGFWTFGSDYLAMTDISSGSATTMVESGTLKKASCSVGDGLLQAVAGALFKKIGRNAALLNESDLVSTLNTKFHEALGGAMNESEESYADSKYFKRYLASGRYQNDAADANLDLGGSSLNNDTSYNMNNTLVNMVINISGSVIDTDSGPDFQANSDAINTVFGSLEQSGGDGSGHHKIQSNGVYDIKVFVQLRHDERF